MAVPLLDLTRQYRRLGPEIEEAALGVLRSGRYVLGPEVEAFEAEIADYLGCRHVVGLSSGTDALLAALMALDVGPGDEVALPVYSFFATAGTVHRLGATPVFVDVAPPHLGMDIESLAHAVAQHPRLKAVIGVHLYGAAMDVEHLGGLLLERGVPLIEDAAQAIGTRGVGPDGTPGFAGTWGVAGCFSTFPTKNLGGAGDGGFLTSDDEDFASRVRSLRNHGQSDAYRHEEIGGNFRLDALQAAVLRVKLRHIEEITAARRDNAARYRAAFTAAGLDDWIEAPIDMPDRHAYHQFVVHLPAADRDRVRRALADRGIGSAVYYPLPFHLQPCFADLGYRRGDFPAAEDAAARNLALPIFPELTGTEIDEVVEALRTAR